MQAWAVKHWNAGLYNTTVRRTRAEAIAAFKELYGVSDHKWIHDAHRFKIHKCVRVEILVTAEKPLVPSRSR